MNKFWNRVTMVMVGMMGMMVAVGTGCYPSQFDMPDLELLPLPPGSGGSGGAGGKGGSGGEGGSACQSEPEVCDGADNDCDGVTDNGNPEGGAPCDPGKLGVCAAGTIQCTNGALVCTQTLQPTPETCDGLDNDCDGVVDMTGVSCSTDADCCAPGTCKSFLGIKKCTQ